MAMSLDVYQCYKLFKYSYILMSDTMSVIEIPASCSTSLVPPMRMVLRTWSAFLAVPL